MTYKLWYQILDIFFVVFHTSVILFNVSGWIWKRTRILNLILLSVTGATWLFIGLLVGTLGYCPLTDWHFSVLEKLGKTGLPSSYIEYLGERLSGLDLRASVVDKITLCVFIGALTISLTINLCDFLRKRSAGRDYPSL
jgi:hypothetical protein